jgi:hypothetical protein
VPLDWTRINPETLRSVDLDALVRDAEQLECISFASEVARFEREEGRWSSEQHECLRFIGTVLTMMLRSDQPAEPYGPMFVVGQRSAIPADFDKQGLIALETWVRSLNDSELRARFLDVIWVHARSFPTATGAVGAYIDSALRLEHPRDWSAGQERLERALRLAASLGRGGTDLRLKVLGAIEAMLHRHRGTDPLYLTMRLTRLLLEFGHGDPKQFAEYALAAATTAEAVEDFRRSKDYYQLLAECHRAAAHSSGEAAALRCAADALVKEADLARKQPGRGAIAAASLLSDAVEAMRQVPDGRQRAAELHHKLIDLQKEAVGELKAFSTSTEASELINSARSAVRNKPLKEAVLALCVMARPPSITKLMIQVQEQARVAVLSSLFSTQVLNSRGRVVAIAPGLEPGADDLKQEGLRWRLFQQAHLSRTLTVQARLNPAREEIDAVHSPDRQDIAALIQHSPWIPPGHEECLMRALLAGFQGDMIVAAHLVPPQFEAVVRHVVEIYGGTTSKLEPGGVQPERSLGPLLETPEALRAFGEDGLFELQDLFTEQLGTNLRNEVAHGLIDDPGLFGSDVLYAWWLLLKTLVITSKLAEQWGQNANKAEGSETSAASSSV